MQKKQIVSGLSVYKQLFRDNRQYFVLVKIVEVEVAEDGASVQVTAEDVLNGHEHFFNASFDSALQGAILKNELWVACFANGDTSYGFLIQKVANEKHTIHPKARQGETVLSCTQGKKVNISSNHEAVLDQSAVLGPELVEWLLKLTAEVKGLANKINSLSQWAATHTHPVVSVGSPTGPPVVPATTTATPEKTAIEAIEPESETDKFLSDFCFIQERDKNTES